MRAGWVAFVLAWASVASADEPPAPQPPSRDPPPAGPVGDGAPEAAPPAEHDPAPEPEPDPEPPAPDPEADLPELPDEARTIAAAPYPRAFVQRPLIAPSGTATAAAVLALETFGEGALHEHLTVAPSLAATPGNVELEVGLRVLLSDSEPQDPFSGRGDARRIQGAFAAIRTEHHGWLVGAGFDYAARFEGADRYTPSVFIANKLHTSASTAITFSSAGGVIYQRVGLGQPGDRETSSSLAASVSVRPQLQLAPLVAVAASATFSVLETNAPMTEQQTVLAQQFGMDVAISASPTLDVFGSLEIDSLGNNVKAFTIGVTARKLP